VEKLSVQVVVEQDEDGCYIASCPSLQGCHSQGDSFEEALENIKDVIEMCIEELREEKKTLDLRYPEVIAIKHLEVTLCTKQNSNSQAGSTYPSHREIRI
jgi:predicted RNase H-like HicB family nuclease